MAKSRTGKTTKSSTAKKTSPKPKSEHQFGDAVVGEYNGNPTISLPMSESGRFNFTFGLGKASAIVEYFDDIKKFVDKNKK